MFFPINDDAIIESILSGGFSDQCNAHAVYMRYPLSWFLKVLYALVPGIPWYGLFLLSCYVFAFSVFCYIGIKHFNRKFGLLLFVLTAALWMFVPPAIIVHYTTAAAALAAAGILLSSFQHSNALIVFVFVLCFCTRKDVFFLSMPFWFVNLLFRFYRQREKKILFLPIAVAFTCGLCAMINTFAYKDAAWKEYFEYNDARTELVDYTKVVPYDIYQDIYEANGISADDFAIVQYYAYYLDSNLNADFFYRVIHVSDDTAVHESFRLKFTNTVKEYFRWIYHRTEPYTWVAITLYILLIIVFFYNKAWIKLLLTFGLGLGRSILWIYLFFRGRFPNHVMISIIVIEMATLAVILMEEFVQEKYKAQKYQIIFAFAAVVLLGGACISTKESIKKQIEQKNKRSNFEVVKEYFDANPDSVYLLDVWSMWDYSRGVFETSKGKRNYFLAGGWYSNSPVVNELFAEMGTQDGGEALKCLDKVYYVIESGKDYTWLESYLECDITVSKEIGKFQILKVNK